MPEPPAENPDRQLELLLELARANDRIAGDLSQLGDGLWAIHGTIPVDGDVIMAEFGSVDAARTVLGQVPNGTHPHPIL
jgi:hypothetical protein